MADEKEHIDEPADVVFDKEQEKETTILQTDHIFTLEGVVSAFSKLFAVDSTNQLDELESIIDSLLIDSGECCSLTDQIRDESKKLLFTSMPEFYETREAMQKIFKQIDTLEEFVSAIKVNVDQLEESVQIAEKELGNKNIKKIISSIPIPSFFTPKKQHQNLQRTEEKEFEPRIPEIFKVDDYLNPEEDNTDSS